MLPALLHGVAFAIALFVQSIGSPLAGAWLLFFLAGCVVLLYHGGYPRSNNPVWYASLAWLLAIGASTFILAPIKGAGAWMWILAAMPALALCLRKEHLVVYAKVFFAVIAAYAVGLIVQKCMGVHYTTLDYTGRMCWPLIDPNNAAAVVNLGMVPSFYLAMSNPLWFVPCIIFVLALLATGSKAGIIAAAIACGILLIHRDGIKAVVLIAALACLTFWAAPHDALVKSFDDRLPIWEASLPLLWIRPLAGLGFGSFAYYYSQVRTEVMSYGWHSHNDLLQIGVEAGIPAAIIFCLLILAVLITTRRSNIVAACTMLAVFLQSMVEFQFYIPAISIPMGLALAYHQINYQRSPK